jgi:hypothetical protein
VKKPQRSTKSGAPTCTELADKHQRPKEGPSIRQRQRKKSSGDKSKKRPTTWTFFLLNQARSGQRPDPLKKNCLQDEKKATMEKARGQAAGGQEKADDDWEMASSSRKKADGGWQQETVPAATWIGRRQRRGLAQGGGRRGRWSTAGAALIPILDSLSFSLYALSQRRPQGDGRPREPRRGGPTIRRRGGEAGAGRRAATRGRAGQRRAGRSRSLALGGHERTGQANDGRGEAGAGRRAATRGRGRPTTGGHQGKTTGRPRRRGRPETEAAKLDRRKRKFQIKARVAACSECPRPGR